MMVESSHKPKPGAGERIVVGPLDLAGLRAARQTRQGHHMLGHLRSEAYPHYGRPDLSRRWATSPVGGNVGRSELTRQTGLRVGARQGLRGSQNSLRFGGTDGD